MAIVIPYGVQLLVANFVEPIILGKRLHLHPVVVLTALVFWYMMWGVAGAFLSVPIMSVIKIFCQVRRNIHTTHYAVLLYYFTSRVFMYNVIIPSCQRDHRDTCVPYAFVTLPFIFHLLGSLGAWRHTEHAQRDGAVVC